MIDTVVFRINDLEANKNLVKFLDRRSEREGFTKWTKIIMEEDFIPIAKKAYLQNYIEIEEKGKRIMNGYSNFLDSYLYDIHYYIDIKKDSINFNVSIPKLYYGTNVFMLFPNYTTDKFDTFSFFEDKKYMLKGFDYLKKFFRYFFDAKLNNPDLNLEDVEIDRIDMCFNKIFDSEDTAHLYLNEIKRVNKKWLRKNKSYQPNYHTGIYYPTRDYTFKIYHKGAEFMHHDKAQLMRINREKGQIFNTPLIQGFANRIVRYELEFRKGIMSRIFKDKIYAKDDPFYQTWKKNTNIMRSNNGYLNRDGKAIRKNDLSKKEKLMYDYCKEFADKGHSFHMRVNELPLDYIDLIGEKVFDYQRRVEFTREIYNRMVDKFFEIVAEFKVSDFEEIQKVIRYINGTGVEDNKTAKVMQTYFDKRRSGAEYKASTFKAYLYWLRENTFKEIVDSKLMSRATAYRYRKLCKDLNISDVNSEKPIKTLASLREYVFFIRSNYGKLKNLHK